MIDLRPVTHDDIRHVVYRMWRRGVDEIKRHGDINCETITKAFCDSAFEHGYAFYYKGEPVAVFGAMPIQEGVYCTWFTATDKFHHIGRAATRYLRRMTKEKVAARPGVQLQIWTGVDHPDADRWFNLLGFFLLRKEGVFSIYHYDGVKSVDSAPQVRQNTGIRL